MSGPNPKSGPGPLDVPTAAAAAAGEPASHDALGQLRGLPPFASFGGGGGGGGGGRNTASQDHSSSTADDIAAARARSAQTLRNSAGWSPGTSGRSAGMAPRLCLERAGFDERFDSVELVSTNGQLDIAGSGTIDAMAPGVDLQTLFEDDDGEAMPSPRVLGAGTSAKVTLLELPGGTKLAVKRVDRNTTHQQGTAFADREKLFATRYQRVRQRIRKDRPPFHTPSRATVAASVSHGGISAYSAQSLLGPHGAPLADVATATPSAGGGDLAGTTSAATSVFGGSARNTSSSSGAKAASGDGRSSQQLPLLTFGDATHSVVDSVNVSSPQGASLLHHHHGLLRHSSAPSTTSPLSAMLPNVVPLKKATLHSDGAVTLVMAFMSGGHAGKHFPEPTPPRTVLLVTRDVLRGLVSVHRDLGLVHRDIKPANILFDDDGVAHIADFGCCSSVDVPADDQCGTLSCMAPERLSGEPHGPPSDTWSVALLVAQLLVGTMHPYRLLIPEERTSDSFWCLVEGLRLAGGVDAIDEAVTALFDRYFGPFLAERVPAMAPGDQEISHWLVGLVRRIAIADAQLRPPCATLLEDAEEVVAAAAAAAAAGIGAANSGGGLA